MSLIICKLQCYSIQVWILVAKPVPDSSKKVKYTTLTSKLTAAMEKEVSYPYQ